MLMRSVTVLLSFLLVGIAPVTASAVNFSAEVVDVDGKAYITPKSGGSVPVAEGKNRSKTRPPEVKKSGDLEHLYEEGEMVNDEGKIYVSPGKAVPAVKGQKLFPGDVVETKEGSELELLYADGNVTRVGENSKLAIVALSVEKNGPRGAVIDLAVGKIKNSVLKLANKQSKFEAHTKTVVAGVTGTPHWIMTASGDLEQDVEVQLLSESGGKEATQGVFVRGGKKSSKSVVLRPGTSTEVPYGKSPTTPKAMSRETISTLGKILPLKTAKQTQLETRRRFDDIYGGAMARREPAEEPAAKEAPAVETAPREKVEFGEQDYNQVQFDSKPDGAAVNVDGKFLGNTPLSVPVRDGVHNVGISLPGYANWNKKVTTTAGFRVLAVLEKAK